MRPFKNKSMRLEEKKLKKTREDWILNYFSKCSNMNFMVGIFCCILLAFIVLIGYKEFFRPASFWGISMEPTFYEGYKGVLSNAPYLFHDIERGDIISFRSHEYELDFVKRVIGIGGDTISFNEGQVYLNGEVYAEEYIPEDQWTLCIKSFVVPEGHLFVMGDNRFFSCDSRFFEQPYISVDDVYGKMIGITWPLFCRTETIIDDIIAILCATYLTLCIPSYVLLQKRRQRLVRAKELILERHRKILLYK